MRFGMCVKGGRGCEVGKTYVICSGGVLRDVYEAVRLDGRLFVKPVCVARFGDGEIGSFFGMLREVA